MGPERCLHKVMYLEEGHGYDLRCEFRSAMELPIMPGHYLNKLVGKSYQDQLTDIGYPRSCSAHGELSKSDLRSVVAKICLYPSMLTLHHCLPSWSE